MFTQLPHLSAARPLAALAVALTFGLGLYMAGGAANPANADASQWTRSSSTWGNSTGWNQHWRSQTHNQFNGTRVIVGGGSGVIITRPGFVTGNSGFIVRQPGFIVRQPRFIVNQPGFIVRQPRFIVNQPGFIVNQSGFIVTRPAFVQRPNFIFERPSFARKQWQFINRHPSLRANRPWWHNNWSHKHWHQMSGGMNWGGMH
ncbi:MAG TPA: hypothetical protein VJV39_18680 [Dongiaceae bacterium]|nr:hypothetical protein [Dongiaceae bacterium]